MRPVLSFVLIVALCGCGGAAYKSSSGYAQSDNYPASEVSKDEYRQDDGGDGEADYREEAYPIADSKVMGSAGWGAVSPPAPQSLKKAAIEPQHARSPVKAITQTKEPNAAPEKPMVVYLGYLRLRVKRLLEAVNEITAITEKQGGYIESLTHDVIIVRVPANDFDAVMELFANIGDLLERQIESLDITDQFTDLGARLTVAREARDRLLKLLEKVEDVEERLMILQEVQRLSEQIETVESKLATLKNLVDYFTITIELEPILEEGHVGDHSSPFYWIQGLEAHRTSIYSGSVDIAMTLPDDFVLFDKDDEYRAQSADTTTIRVGMVDNEPLGDNKFWSQAIHFELNGRDEELVDDGEAGALTFQVYRSKDVKPRYYLLAVQTVDEDVFVVEVFYPNEESYEAHREDVKEALETFKVN